MAAARVYSEGGVMRSVIKIKRYEIEMFLNKYYLDNNLPIEIVELDSVSQPAKAQKQGAISGFFDDLAMGRGNAKRFGIKEIYTTVDVTYNTGLRMMREILAHAVRLCIPGSTEYLDPDFPRYLNDCYVHGWFGARSVGAQNLHDLASALSTAVGCKNENLHGSLEPAIAAILKSREPRGFKGLDLDGYHPEPCHPT